jgi:2-oxoisovalerate dehydrogenase E1 component alpha subunit
MPGVRVDGNDVLAVHATVRAMLDRARDGGGPALIEAVTYRMEAHTASDDPTRYRDDAEVDEWRARDPITRVERFLRREHGLDDAGVAAAARGAEQAAERIRRWADREPELDPMSMFDHVYAEPPHALASQRCRLADELARRGET